MIYTCVLWMGKEVGEGTCVGKMSVGSSLGTSHDGCFVVSDPCELRREGLGQMEVEGRAEDGFVGR